MCVLSLNFLKAVPTYRSPNLQILYKATCVTVPHASWLCCDLDSIVYGMCRLLRNRVSAQQARERKKSYVSTIEEKVHDQDSQLAQLQQRVQILERENGMLRQVIKNIKGSNKDAMLVPSAKSYQDTARVPVFGES